MLFTHKGSFSTVQFVLFRRFFFRNSFIINHHHSSLPANELYDLPVAFQITFAVTFFITVVVVTDVIAVDVSHVQYILGVVRFSFVA